MKILVVADAPTVKTGFSRVSEKLCVGLVNQGHEVVLLGVNDPADPHDYPFKIYSAFNAKYQDVMGFNRLPSLVTKEKPDVVLLFNDCWVCERYYEGIKKQHKTGDFKVYAYFPVDSSDYLPALVSWLNEIDGVATYTQFGVDVLRAAKFNKPVEIIPHGTDVDLFHPLDKLECRKQINLATIDDQFVVLNANRNQPRKRIDLTIKGFAQFAQGKDDVWLYLHMGAKDVGWDIEPLFEREMAKYGNNVNRLIVTSQSPMPVPVDERMLSLIYNSADVNVNTSVGEGWGLTGSESSACAIAQIQPNHSACAELWGDNRGLLTDIATWETDKDLLIERGVISVDDFARNLELLYTDQKLLAELRVNAYDYFTQSNLTWEKIIDKFNAWLIKLV